MKQIWKEQLNEIFSKYEKLNEEQLKNSIDNFLKEFLQAILPAALILNVDYEEIFDFLNEEKDLSKDKLLDLINAALDNNNEKQFLNLVSKLKKIQ